MASVDPFEKVSKDQPLEIRASSWNRMQEAAQIYQRLKLGDGRGEATDFAIDPQNLAWFQAPSDLVEFSVLAYGSAINPPTDNPFVSRMMPAFNGGAPSSPTSPFVVTVEPILSGTIGRAAVSGLVPVQVLVLDDSHMRAHPAAGVTSYLVSDSSTGVPIVWIDTGSGSGSSGSGSSSAGGLHWAIVLLTDSGGGGESCCPIDPPPYTLPILCQSGSGGTTVVISGSGGSGGQSTTCWFVKSCLDPDALYTVTGWIIGGWAGDNTPILGIRLTGDAIAAALAACNGNAQIIYGDDCPGTIPGLVFPQSMCLWLMNGTRSYITLNPPIQVNGIFDGSGWHFTGGSLDVTVAGDLILCPQRDPAGFYFSGTITSSDPDPFNPGEYDCGCIVRVGGCTDGNGVLQIITAIDLAEPSETLHVTTGCGTLDIRFAKCDNPPPPPPPPPPGVCCGFTFPPPTSITVVVPDGPNAGTYVLNRFPFTPSIGMCTAAGAAKPACITCTGSTGWQLTLGGVGASSSSSSCGPFSATFSGAAFGSTGAITAS